MRRFAVMLIACGAGGAWGGDAEAGDVDPYFHAIHCKAVWGELTNGERTSVPGTDAAIAAVDRVLQGYVVSGAKTDHTIDTDIADLKAYSGFEAHHLKDWRDCVAFYAGQHAGG